MPTLSLDGVDLYYEREGRGPPLLLVAGLFSDSASWQPVRKMLAEQYDLVVFDNRCSGRTRPSPCPIGRPEMVNDCLGLLDHLGIERAHVLGHSLGGVIGLHLAERHPRRVASLVCASTGPVITKGQVALFDDLAALYCAGCVPRHQWFRLLFQWLFSPDFFRDEENVAAAVAVAESYDHIQSGDAVRAQVQALRDFTTPPDLGNIATPVLALTAVNDLLYPPEDVVDAMKALPNFEQVVVPDAAHAVHWERPQAFVDAVAAFHARLLLHA